MGPTPEAVIDQEKIGATTGPELPEVPMVPEEEHGGGKKSPGPDYWVPEGDLPPHGKIATPSLLGRQSASLTSESTLRNLEHDRHHAMEESVALREGLPVLGGKNPRRNLPPGHHRIRMPGED